MNHLLGKLTERAALDHIRKSPRCSNASLAKVLGFSVGGVEKLLRRLRAAGHIQQRGKGRARYFLFPVEHLTTGGIRPGLAVFKREMPTGDYIAERLSCFENCMEAGDYDHARNHLELARKRLEMDAQFPAEEKAKLLAGLKVPEDRSFAFSVGAMMADGRPTSEQRELARTLSRASAEQLALFRQRVEAGASLRDTESILALIGG
jgi:hypothetical protein